MREIAEVRIRDLSAQLVDLDVTPGGSYVAIAAVVDRRMIRDEGRDVGEHTFYRDQRLLFGNAVAAEFPHEQPWPKRVRALDDDTAIVVDCGAEREQPNAWIFNRAGKMLTSFCAGDGIQDVVVCGCHIAVTYFDEGIFGGVSPSLEGVSIFNRAGEFVFGYHSQFGYERASIADCYAACADVRGRLCIFPYTEFPVVRIDLASRVREVFSTPEIVHGASAISLTDDRGFLWGPYHQAGEFFEVPLGSPSATNVGTYPGPLRGLPGGKFLALRSFGYAIISMLD